MNAWAILGIAPGSDRDAVRRAYAAKLKQTNPEDDPAGFMQLREAYEWVLRWGHLDAAAADDDDADDEDEDEEGDEAGDVMGRDGTGIRATHVIIEERQDRPIDPRWADAEDEADVPPPPTPDRWRDPPETDFTPPERPESEWTEQPDFDPEQHSRAQSVWDEDEQKGGAGPWGNRVAHARGGDVDLIEFNTRIQALADCLSGDGPRDDARAAALFDALMQSGALQRLDLRARAEQRIAALLAETIPRSDAVLRQAVKAFGWNDASGRDVSHALTIVRERMDDWRVIAQLNHHSHKLHQGWKALTEPLPGWPMRVWMDRPAVRAQVAKLFDEIEWSAPGLAWSIPKQNVGWWRARIERAPFRLGLAVPFVVMALLLLGGRDMLGLSDAWMWVGGTLCAGLALLDMLLNLTAVPAIEARARQSEHPPRLFRFGWVVPLALLPPLALLAPKSALLTWGLIAAMAPMFLWLRLARQPDQDDEWRRLPLSYILIFAFGLGILGASWPLEEPLRVLMMAVAVLLTLVADPLRRELLRLLSLGRVPGWPLALAAPYLVALGAMALWGVTQGWLAPIYAVTIWGVAQNLVSRALAGNESAPVVLWRWAAHGLMVAAFVMAFGAARDSARSGDTMAQSALSPGEAIVAVQRPLGNPTQENAGLRGETRTAMAAMAAHNPALYAKIKGALSALTVLSSERARQDAATRIDALINQDLPNHVTDMPFAEEREGILLQLYVLKDLRTRNVAACAQGALSVDRSTPAELHQRVSIHSLRVVSGLGDPMPAVQPGAVLTMAAAKAAEPAIRDAIAKLPAADRSGTADQVKQCDDRLARVMQLTRLSLSDLKATLAAMHAAAGAIQRTLPQAPPPHSVPTQSPPLRTLPPPTRTL